MTANAHKVELGEVVPLRALFLQETNFQIRYNACHERGWADSYLLRLDDVAVGYGSIKGQEIAARDTVFEYFIVPQYRRRASALFQELLSASRADYIECQSNDLLLSSMLYEFSACVSADTVLFEDHAVTEHHPAGAIFRRRRNDDRIFEHAAEPVGDYVVEENGEVIATGGFLVHYNPPFADLFMEVRADRRNRGVGSYLLQEVKKECYRAGRVPAARTGLDNLASRATLLKAGLRICGFMLKGRVQVPSA